MEPEKSEFHPSSETTGRVDPSATTTASINASVASQEREMIGAAIRFTSLGTGTGLGPGAFAVFPVGSTEPSIFSNTAAGDGATITSSAGRPTTTGDEATSSRVVVPDDPLAAELVHENTEHHRVSSQVELALSRYPVVPAAPFSSETTINNEEAGDGGLFADRSERRRKKLLGLSFIAIPFFAAVAVVVPVALTSYSPSSPSSSSIATDNLPTPTPTNDGPGSTKTLSPTMVGSGWRQIGQEIVGKTMDRFGASVALSANGTIMAAGSVQNDGVRVFSLSSTGQRWEQMGQDIGENEVDAFLGSVALSADGMILAARSAINDEDGGNLSLVRVFVYDKDAEAWKQLGQDIFSEATGARAAGDLWGTSVRLSADGLIVAAGAPYNDEAGFQSGHVRVFAFSNSTQRWEQLGQRY